MGTRKRRLTEADRRAAEKIRALWADYKKKNPGISQEVAAARAGMTQSAFSQFLVGSVPMRVTPVVKLARLFGVAPTEIRADIGSLPYAAIEPKGDAPGVREPDHRTVSPEAMEIARAFDHLQPQTKQRAREYVFMLAAVDRSFPWLRTGKPISPSYDSFEKTHEENMRAQLALEAARIAKIRR